LHKQSATESADGALTRNGAMMKNNNSMLMVSVFLLCTRLGFAVDAEDLLRLSRLEGKDYVRERDKLVVEDTPLPVVSDAKLKLLSGILKARRSDAELFKTVNKIIQRSRVLREKMTDEEIIDMTRNTRYQKLGFDLSKYRAKNVAALNMAMAELLWKTAADDYERISAFHVLSLNSCPIVGVFEVSHDLVQKTVEHALARELLGLVSQYTRVYKRGNKQLVMNDIDLVSKRFANNLDIQKRCLELLEGAKARETSTLSAEIRNRIKAVKEARREEVGKNKPPEEENILITGNE